jgi:hypothetical protein
VDFLANVPLQHAVLDRPVFGKVQLSLILDLSSIRSKEMDTELALLPAGQWQADVPLTQQAGTPLKSSTTSRVSLKIGLAFLRLARTRRGQRD